MRQHLAEYPAAIFRPRKMIKISAQAMAFIVAVFWRRQRQKIIPVIAPSDIRGNKVDSFCPSKMKGNVAPQGGFYCAYAALVWLA